MCLYFEVLEDSESLPITRGRYRIIREVISQTGPYWCCVFVVI